MSIKVLAIGNSFSQDATRYLHQIAKADGVDLTVVNLFIGGCSLFRHFKNIQMDLKDYILEFNGESTEHSDFIHEVDLVEKSTNLVSRLVLFSEDNGQF